MVYYRKLNKPLEVTSVDFKKGYNNIDHTPSMLEIPRNFLTSPKISQNDRAYINIHKI